MIPKAFIETVTHKTDLVELAGRYTELVASGKNMVGLCPFDGGNKPTFTVSPEKQIWKCFKCGKGGNAVGLVEVAEKLSFPSAIRFLAKRLDLEIPQEDET
jgi:DNA primase